MEAGARAVLFDAAGTLIAPREPPGETYARAARACGIEACARRLGEALVQSLARAPRMVFPGAAAAEIDALERAWWSEVTGATFERAGVRAAPGALRACFDRLFACFASADAWIVAEGAHAALAALRARGFATGVVSNFDRRLFGILDGLSLRARLDLVVLPSLAGAAKPDPAIFAFALAALGLPAQCAIFVGDDRAHDLDPARAAGMHAIDVQSLATLADLPDRIATESRPPNEEKR
ncbi:MAG: HAD-IA family hydrolase [Myxococcales bacterium]|nr:HAD-IA family hydrolase [Myxococcales bacterium]MDH5566859.1 HAD-IA family hydrolase [Myxococcales bacterium]